MCVGLAQLLGKMCKTILTEKLYHMSNEIGWRFPPTSGGRVDGFNDPGIAHFTGSPLVSLARETIQNSLDASLTLDTPVHVSFELITVRPASIGQE